MACADSEKGELELTTEFSKTELGNVQAESSILPGAPSMRRSLREDPMMSFNIFIGFMIMFNSIVMGVETDHDLGLTGKVLENFFTVTWVVEIIVRNVKMTPKCYFTDPWSLMDFVLAWLSICSLWILPGQGTSLRLLSVLRILRLLRLLRLLRFLRFFRGLLLLVYGLVKAFLVLSWVVVLLVIVVYVTALLMTNQIGHQCDSTYAEFSDCREMFGTIPSSMYTMFQVITLESWSMAVARPILRENAIFVVVFLIFLYLTTFGLLNIVTGVIVDQTQQASSEGEVREQARLMKKKREEALLLGNLFTTADIDGNGIITQLEFLTKCEEQHVIDDFRNFSLQVTPCDAAKRLFDVLDCEHHGELPVDVLLQRTQHLLGEGQNMLQDCNTFFLVELRSAAHQLEKNLTKRLEARQESSDIVHAIQAIADMERRMTIQLAALEDKFHDKLQSIERDHRIPSL